MRRYPSPGFLLRYLKGRLCLDESGYEVVEVGWVDVADGDDAQVGCGGGAEVEAGEGGRECGEGGDRSFRSASSCRCVIFWQHECLAAMLISH
jgi:hypothetical protein